jgi:hypothetical protein
MNTNLLHIIFISIIVSMTNNLFYMIKVNEKIKELRMEVEELNNKIIPTIGETE